LTLINVKRAKSGGSTPISAFLLSDTAGERIREFRIDRVASIGADETPVALDPFPKIILQLIPSSFSDFQFQVDLGQAKKFYMKSFGTSGLRRFRYNFDGWLGYDGEPTAFSYVQLFRSGTVETVDASTLRESSIPSVYFEKELFNTVRDLLKFQADIGVEPPLFALLTLINVKGYSMAVRDVIRRTPTPIDRDHLFVPEVIIESFESKNELVVKALVDPVWRACGFLETPYFNGEQQRFLWPR